MTISQKYLRSETGFESPGFVVDTGGNINFVGSLRSNGQTLLTPTSLASGIANSSLTSVGTLIGLTVQGNTSISGGTVSINSNGALTISSTLPGSINNVNIGSVTPGTATFTDVTVTGTLNITDTFLKPAPVTTGTIDNYNIGLTTRGSGAFTALSANLSVTLAPTVLGSINNVTIGQATASTGRFTNVTVTNTPTNSTHVTTKQYVDNKISAFAIALGS
jgi:hypothetical protein